MKLIKWPWNFVTIAILALAPYMQTVTFDFALDDSIFITKNSRVKQGLSNIPALFENARSGKVEHETGYRPITLLSFATDVHFFGMKSGAFHLVNAVLYVLTCLLVLLLMNSMFPDNPWLCWWIALIYAVHPLHVEVVANIKGRDELLAMIFGLLFLLTLVRYMKTGQVTMLILAPILFLLASLSKESAITFAGIGLGMALVCKTDKQTQKIYVGVASLASIALVLLMRSFVYSDSFFDNKIVELEDMGVYHSDMFLGNPLVDANSFFELLANALNLVWHTIQMFVVPHPLIHDYSYNHFPVVDWGHPQVYLGLAVVTGLVYLIFKGRNSGGSIAIGALWFLATISVYLSLARPASDIFAERFLFSPSLGLSIVFIGTLSKVRLSDLTRFSTVGVIALGFLILTWNRCPAWKNNESLFKADIVKLPNCVRANYNYALLLHQRYNEHPLLRAKGDEEKILFHYNQALETSDRLANLYLALGNAYMSFGQPLKGVETFNEASRKYPHLTTPLVQLGNYYFKQKELDSAIQYFEKAIELGEVNPEYHTKLGLALYQCGQVNRSVQVMLDAEKYAGKYPTYYHKFILICVKADRLLLAKEIVVRGVARFPNDRKLNDYKRQFDQLSSIGKGTRRLRPR